MTIVYVMNSKWIFSCILSPQLCLCSGHFRLWCESSASIPTESEEPRNSRLFAYTTTPSMGVAQLSSVSTVALWKEDNCLFKYAEGQPSTHVCPGTKFKAQYVKGNQSRLGIWNDLNFLSYFVIIEHPYHSGMGMCAVIYLYSVPVMQKC